VAQAPFYVPHQMLYLFDVGHEFVDGVGDGIELLLNLALGSGAPDAFLNFDSRRHGGAPIENGSAIQTSKR
jgi:hypothetical protein